MQGVLSWDGSLGGYRVSGDMVSVSGDMVQVTFCDFQP